MLVMVYIVIIVKVFCCLRVMNMFGCVWIENCSFVNCFDSIFCVVIGYLFVYL